MRLRVLVGRQGPGQLTGRVIDVVVALARPIDPVGPVQAGIEPLRRVWRDHLVGEHEAQLVMERPGVLLRREVAALPAPVGPASGEAIEDLLRRCFGSVTLAFRQQGQRRLVGDGAPQPRRNGILFNLRHPRRNTGLAEILLCQDVGRDLAPGLGDLDPVKLEHHRPVRVADLARGEPEGEGRVRRLVRLCVTPVDPH